MTSVTTLNSVSYLSNAELLSAIVRLARCERAATVQLLAALAEVDDRRLFLGEGCASLFVYCTRVLRLSEYATLCRIKAARLARRFPVVLELLEDGALTLTTVCLLAPYLTHANHAAMLDAARHKSKREVELQLAAVMMRADVPTLLRRWPDRHELYVPAAEPFPPSATGTSSGTAADPSAAVTAGSAASAVSASGDTSGVLSAVHDVSSAVRSLMADPPPAVIAPLSPERFEVQFTISKDTHDRLRRLQDLMRHQIPTGDIAVIVDKALVLLLEHVERAKLAAVKAPRQSAAARERTRHVPASVKREIWKRDGGCCAFVGTQGRCEERAFLEYHHVKPYTAGGATTAENLELRCHAHNRYEADQFLGSGASVAREVAGTSAFAVLEAGAVDELWKLCPDLVSTVYPQGGSQILRAARSSLPSPRPSGATWLSGNSLRSPQRDDASSRHQRRIDVVTEKNGRISFDHE